MAWRGTKILANSVNRQDIGRIKQGAREWQRGFVRGRPMMGNVCELGTAPRCEGINVGRRGGQYFLTVRWAFRRRLRRDAQEQDTAKSRA